MHVNMDETAVKLVPAHKPGYLACSGGRALKHLRLHERRASLNLQRSCLSLVAFVCDNGEVQKALPQIIIGSWAVLRVTDVSRIARLLPDNVFVLRRKSAWVTADLLTDIVKLLGIALAPCKANRTFVLSMDACPSHTAEKVARACARQDVHLMYVPAQMTKWLQPLDTHCFAKLKRFVSREYEKDILLSPDGSVSAYQVLCILVRAVPAVLETEVWTNAFQHVGLRDQQRHVSKTFLTQLGWTEVPEIPSDLPTLEELQLVFKAGSAIPVGALFEMLMPSRSRDPVLRLPRASREGGGSAADDPPPDDPWRGRLRSSSSQALLTPMLPAPAEEPSLAPHPKRMGIPRTQWLETSVSHDVFHRDPSRGPRRDGGAASSRG